MTNPSPGDSLRQMLSHASDGMILTDERGCVIFWNQAMTDLTSIPQAEVLGRPLWDAGHGLKISSLAETLLLPRETVEEILRTGNVPLSTRVENSRSLHPDGSPRVLQTQLEAIKTSDGHCLGIVTRDISGQRMMDARLANLARFPAENPNPVMRIGKSGQILFANEPSRPILEEWNAGMGELAPREWLAMVREALSSGKKKQFDQRIQDLMFSVTIVPFQDLGYANIYMIDETQRIQVETTLRERENELASLYEVMPVGVCITDEDGKFVYLNDMYCQLYGYRREELIGNHFEIILPPDEKETGISTFPGLLSGQMNLLPTLRRRVKKDGTPFIVEAYNSALTRASGKRLLITVVNDVTHRVHIEETQRRSEERSRRLASRLESISRVTRQISAIMDLTDVYQLVVNMLQGETGCHNANLVLVEGETAYCVAACCPEAPDEAQIGFSQPVGTGVIGRAARTGQPQLVVDVATDADYISGPYSAEMTSELAMPIKTGSQVLGVLDVQYNRPDAFDQTDVEALGILADQLAITFENSRLFGETRRRASDLEGLVQASAALRSTQSRASVMAAALRECMHLFKARGAAIILVEPTTQDAKVELATGSWEVYTGQRIPPGEGLASQVLASGHLLIDNQAAQNPSLLWPEAINPQDCMAVAPMIISGQVIGALAIVRPSAFTSYDGSLISAASDMAAISIQRETLHEQTIASLQRVSALHTVDMAINASLDMHFTLNVLLEQLTGQLNAHGACILLFNPKTLTLEYGAARGFTGGAVTRVRIRMGDQLAGKVALERRTIRVPSPTGSTQYFLPPSLIAEGFVTYFGIPLVAKGQLKGVIELLHRSEYPLDSSRIEFMETLADQAAIAIDNAELFKNLQVSNTELSLAYDATIEGWSKAMDLRDRETEGHTRRVTDTTMRLAREMGMADQEVMYLRRGALLHDIGKMGIPDSILLKAGPLTDDEWMVMRKHPEYAFDLLAPITFLRPSIEIPYCHHERWDGSGYPRKLKGDQIPLAARIFSVVDVWDALLSDRPYRKAWPEKDVLKYIKEQAGSQFDPRVVETFLKLKEA